MSSGQVDGLERRRTRGGLICNQRIHLSRRFVSSPAIWFFWMMRETRRHINLCLRRRIASCFSANPEMAVHIPCTMRFASRFDFFFRFGAFSAVVDVTRLFFPSLQTSDCRHEFFFFMLCKQALELPNEKRGEKKVQTIFFIQFWSLRCVWCKIA